MTTEAIHIVERLLAARRANHHMRWGQFLMNLVQLWEQVRQGRASLFYASDQQLIEFLDQRLSLGDDFWDHTR